MHWFPSSFLPFLCFPLGIVFGFLLRKATVSRFDTIVGQLTLKDFTVMKVILTAIVVGGCGLSFINGLGALSQWHLSTTPLLLSLIGGSVFGVGMSLAGYCPGTALASLGEGARDMLWGVSGMLVGAALFNKISVSSGFLAFTQNSKSLTLGQFFAIPNSVILCILIAMWFGFYFLMQFIEGKGKSEKQVV